LDFSKDEQTKLKFQGGLYYINYQTKKDSEGRDIITYISFDDSKTPHGGKGEHACGHWDPNARSRQMMLKDRMIAYINIFYTDRITGLEVSVYPAGNGEIKAGGLRDGEDIKQ